MDKLVIQIYLEQKWHDCAVVEFANTEESVRTNTSLEFEMDYFDHFAQFEGSKGRYSVSLVKELDLVKKPYSAWPSFLLDLMPQGVARSAVCRRLGISDLAKHDFQILKEGSINPIGNLRVKNPYRLFQSTEEPSFTLKEISENKEEFLEHAEQYGAIVVGGTGAQGMAPKYLMNQDELGRWTCDGSLKEEFIHRSCIIKLPKSRGERDVLILKSEKKYMDIARELGLNVHATLELNEGMLIIERFDRRLGRDFERLGYESLSSVIGHKDFGLPEKMENYIKLIAENSSNPKEDILEFIGRDFLNIAMGNTDNHGRNFAFLKYDESTIRLSPLFDFAPMVMDDSGIPRVTKWSREIHYIPDFSFVDKVLKGHGFVQGELDEFYAIWIDRLNRLDEAFETFELDRLVIEIATRKKNALTEALRRHRGIDL